MIARTVGAPPFDEVQYEKENRTVRTTNGRPYKSEFSHIRQWDNAPSLLIYDFFQTFAIAYVFS